MFGWIKKRRETPVEERSYSGIYAFWSGVLFLTTLAAVWNEVATRRPWKEYQHDFYRLETRLLEKKLASARSDLDQSGLAEISKELAAANAKLRGSQAAAIMEQIDRYKRNVIDNTTQRGFAKSRADAQNYLYEKNKRLGDMAAARQYAAARDEITITQDKYQALADRYQHKVDSLTAILKPWKENAKDLQAKHDTLMGAVLDIESKIHRAQTSPIEIKQTILYDYDKSVWEMRENRIDRCQTCHVGWNDSLFTGPDFERSLMEQYGSAAKYVSDHYGEKTELAILDVVQGIIFGPRDSLTKGDLQAALGKFKGDANEIWTKTQADKPALIAYKKVFGTHPELDLLKKHNPEKFGCTTCHGGEGMALSTVDEAHGFEEHWDTPLRLGKYVEVACVMCHTQRYDFAPYAQTVSRGKELFLDFGCYGCHDATGTPDFKTMKQAPSLLRVDAKLTPEWMFHWIKNPHAMNPMTRMPNFDFDDKQVDAVVTYLVQASESDYTPVAANAPQGDAARGKDLLNRVGCLGCHATNEFPAANRLKEGNSFGPSLIGVGSKVTKEWLFDWLKNPQHYMPGTRMPNMRLSDQEAADITAYILQDLRLDEPLAAHHFADLHSKAIAAEGFDLIRDYGCYGCHDIKGFEGASKVSVSLSDFGKKIVQQMYFGTIPEDTLMQVQAHFDSIGMTLGNPNGAHHDEDWYTWTILKEKNPRIYQSEAIQQKMPDFSVNDSEAYALSVYLRSMQTVSIPASYMEPNTEIQHALDSGRFYVRWRNCIGCHKIENVGGSVAERIKMVENVPDPLALSPPLLTPEGARVQEQWLYGFLSAPAPIRPWLHIRMPTFGFADSNIATIQKYFLAIHNRRLELHDYADFTPDPALAQAGQILFVKFQCIKCHQMGKVEDISSLAPDLRMAYRRLRPEWIPDWLKDPNAIMPGTRMPSFFPGGISPAPDILGGDADKQMRALRDAVMIMGKKHPA